MAFFFEPMLLFSLAVIHGTVAILTKYEIIIKECRFCFTDTAFIMVFCYLCTNTQLVRLRYMR